MIQHGWRLGKANGCRIVVDFHTPSVAHVIVQKDDENCAQRTLKFFFDGKWTVVIDWVHQYIKDNKFVNEKPFEVLDFDGEIVFVNPEKMGQITSCLEHTNFVVKLISPIWLISLEVQRKAVSLFETIQVVSVSRGLVLDCISGLALGSKSGSLSSSSSARSGRWRSITSILGHSMPSAQRIGNGRQSRNLKKALQSTKNIHHATYVCDAYHNRLDSRLRKKTGYQLVTMLCTFP